MRQVSRLACTDFDERAVVYDPVQRQNRIFRIKRGKGKRWRSRPSMLIH